MDITNKRFFTAALELALEAKYMNFGAGGPRTVRAMTIRIVASFLAILATGLIAAPVETSARGGFAGGHGMSFRAGFRAPIIRPAIAPPTRVAIPAIRPAIARPTRVAVPARLHNTAPFARFRHTIGPRRIWVGAPWYGDYGAPWYGDYGDSTYVVPDGQSPSDTSPTTDANMTPRRLGCSAQTYRVPSEAGGETSVKVVRC